ncbi:3-oxoacyl-[acyl-carrier-protein] synthase II [Desulfomicrobium norvegicum]|uniref:3-oxoacyl-[acyl-carrier-protein] synthase II n=1 Tax=Desulfomicrobium norvegicum (strain DSM 1741 / NCIMB 8310) TaxID=52561 RepID=A0A8G2C327_DESNO|nr:beta-ketoacyl synthase N-terminal-like domain-containing protein [Desulfomicrobium norvegicum]SFL73447.1 3-oxoacyl-[acyl-carrier-protein] synthase II [Desulfomicrobium norvegicum]
MNGARRVVITGSGFVLPLGSNRAEVFSALQRPHGPFVRSVDDPEVAVCPIPDFDLKAHVSRCKNARYLTRGQQLCLAAAVRAVDDAGLGPDELGHAGLFLGLGPNLQARPRDDKALWLLDYLPNTVSSVMAEMLGMHGENLTILTACAASTQALGQAFRAVATGLADVALAGGGDSRLSVEGIRAYKQAGVLATGFDRPELACRPFDQDRCGFAIGEGGAVFTLECLEHAETRGARILAEIVSASSSLDGGSLTGPDPAGHAAGTAVLRCLETLDAEDLCVLAHGTGTVLNDTVEGEILARTVSRAMGITAFKSRIGHLAAACGCTELALGLVCAAKGHFPAIAGLENPCRDDLPLLREPLRRSPRGLLLQSFGFGGQNACLGVRPWI